MKSIQLSVIALAVVSAVLSPVAAVAAGGTAKLPFVSCPSDGQVGPQDGPPDSGQAPRLPPVVAGRLAYYAMTDGPAAVAPRGWHCFGLYGSNGALLMMTPEAQSDTVVTAAMPGHLTGPAVVVSLLLADTSGRFEVAQIEARLFPAKRKFVESVIAEGIAPASDFPFGPFATDTIERRSATDVKFTTPANKDGMATQGQLARNGDPIYGEARITRSGDAVVTDVRLPTGDLDLLPSLLP